MKTTISIIIILLTLGLNTQNNKEPKKQDEVVAFLQTEAFAILNLPFSQAARYGNRLYLSGQIGTLGDTASLVEGGIIPETRQTMLNKKRF